MQWILKDISKETKIWRDKKYVPLSQDYILSTPAQIKVGNIQHPRNIFGIWTPEELYNKTGFKQLEIVDVSPTPEEYYKRDDNFTVVETDYKVTHTYTYIERSVVNFVSDLLDKIEEIREEKIAQGVLWTDIDSTQWVVQTDPSSIRNIMGIVSGVSAGIPLPENFSWRMENNMSVPIDETSLKEIATIVLNHVNHCYNVAWQHKAAINGITTIAALKTYASDTINTLWPEAPV